MAKERTVAELIRDVKALRLKAENADKQSQAMETKSATLKKQSAEYYVEIGKKLIELKAKKPKGTTWPDFVKKNFGYSQTRADELIRIGGGVVTLEDVRANKAERQAKVDAKKSSARNKSDAGSKTSKDKKIDNVIRPSFEKKPKPTPEEGDCDFNPADEDHVKGDTKEMIRRQIFLNMCHHYGCGRKGVIAEPSIGFDKFFSEASPEEATDELFVELDKAIAAWSAVAVKLKALRGASNVKIKA